MDGFDIIKLQNIAYVNAQIAAALIESESMKALNMQRSHLGQSMAFDEGAFLELIDKYQLGHNSVITNLHNGGV